MLKISHIKYHWAFEASESRSWLGSEVLSHIFACEVVRKMILRTGKKALPVKSQNSNGPDLTFMGKNRIFTVEVKTLEKAADLGRLSQ